MLFRVEGLMDILVPINKWEEKPFCVEVEADSEEEAKERAHWKLYRKSWGGFKNFRNENIQSASYAELGELGEWVLRELARKWLRDNYHLDRFGFKPDVLAKPELIPPSQGGGLPLIRYLTPDTNDFLWDPQLDFPKKITPLLLKLLKNKEEARIAIDLVFERIKVNEGREGDGDHHSMTYGEPVIPVYYIDVKEAFALARDSQLLRRLIDQKLTES